jgi:hypothetical protein
MTRILRARKAHPVPIDNAVSDSGEEETPEPIRKRAKRTKPEDKDYDYVHGKAQQQPLASSSSLVPATGRIRRGRVGKLAQLPNMPLDVLHEVREYMIDGCHVLHIFMRVPLLLDICLAAST